MNNLPKAALLQGIKNSVFAVLFVWSVIGATSLILILGLRQPLGSSVFLAWAILWICLCAVVVVTWATNRRRSGPVLLDITPYPARIPALVVSGLILGFIFWELTDFRHARINSPRLVILLIAVSMAGYLCLMAFSRIQARENGLLAYVDLLKWDKIASFAWDHSDSRMSTLKLKFQGRLPVSLRNGAVPVPKDKVDKLKVLLHQHLSGKEQVE